MIPEPSARSKELHKRISAFMAEHILPVEALYQKEIDESKDPLAAKDASESANPTAFAGCC